MMLSSLGDYTYKVLIDGYILLYSITKNINISDPKPSLMEYGISCTAYNADGTISSSEEVKCISPCFYTVATMLDILIKYTVFPLHLRDIITDLIEELPDKVHTSDHLPISA